MSGLCLDSKEGQLSHPGDALASGAREVRGFRHLVWPKAVGRAWEGTLGAPNLERALHPTLIPRGHPSSPPALLASS